MSDESYLRRRIEALESGRKLQVAETVRVGVERDRLRLVAEALDRAIGAWTGVALSREVARAWIELENVLDGVHDDPDNGLPPLEYVPHVDDCFACATGMVSAHDPRCSRGRAPAADGPGAYEVTVEARVTVTAASRRFAELRAANLVGSGFIAGEPAGDRIVVTAVRKTDGPEWGTP